VKESEQAVIHFTEQQKTANMMNTAIKKNKGQGQNNQQNSNLTQEIQML